MFSFLQSWAFRFSQPPPLEDDPTGGPSRTVCPSHTVSDPHHELLRPDSSPGPIDVAPVDIPELFDILLTDVDDTILYNEISTKLGLDYLSEASHLTSPQATVDGILHGRHSRVIFPLAVKLSRSRKSPSYFIHFVYDSGSPFTYLSKEACDKLFGTNPVPTNIAVEINGKRLVVAPPNTDSHFEHVNLLGADFCTFWKTKVIIDYEEETATMHIPSLQEK